MQEAGLFKFWNMNEPAESEKETINDQNVTILAISDVKSIFICWAIGIAVSCLGLILELVTNNYFSNMITKLETRCQSGRKLIGHRNHSGKYYNFGILTKVSFFIKDVQMMSTKFSNRYGNGSSNFAEKIHYWFENIISEFHTGLGGKTRQTRTNPVNSWRMRIISNENARKF